MKNEKEEAGNRRLEAGERGREVSKSAVVFH
jgi:hypothetical protein